MRIGINLLYLLPGIVGGTETYGLSPSVEGNLGLRANIALPETSGSWLRERILFATGSDKTELEFAVRLFGQGSVWFTDMVLLPLMAATDTSTKSLQQRPIIDISYPSE